jgi:FecR-like protein
MLMNKNYHTPLVGILGVLLVTIAISQLTIAAQKKEARVTQVIKDVRLLASGTSPRPASVNDAISSGMAVRTGVDSRTELTFSDQSLTRLGANSIFSFSAGGKEFDLNSGAILVAVPKSSGEVKIKTAAATAAVTGFTLMYEYHPRGISKVMLLDGNVRFQIKGLPTPCVFDGGHMIVIPPHPIRCPDILTFDVEKVLKSAKLITIKPLPQWALDPILVVMEDQKTSPPPGGFTDPTNIDAHDQAANAMPSATPPRHETPPPKPF